MNNPLNFDKLKKETELPFEIARRITKSKITPIYLTSGKIRDFILGRKTNASDYDFVGDFNLDQIQNDFLQLVVGRWDEVATIKLKIGSQIYDFTATTDVERTLKEYDMTLSGLCLDQNGQFYDYTGALQALRKKQIKINEPDRKIILDPSRILRVFRVSSELGFDIEQSTLDAVMSNAHLLKDAEYTSELWKILALGLDLRLDILRNLRLYSIDQYIIYPNEDRDNLQELLYVEKQINQKAPLDVVQQLFIDQPIYLVGGFVRDVILAKPAKDFDFKVKMPLENMIATLEAKGYQRTENLDLEEFEYYVNEQSRAVSIFCGGSDIDLAEIEVPDVATMVRHGDVNFSCCIYNVQTAKIGNPSLINEIKHRELRFCDIERAKEQPLIVVNALKQISRIPEIIVPDETRDIIASSIPSIIKLLKDQPDLGYKIRSICNNLNSEQAYAYFDCTKPGKTFLEGYTSSHKRLATTDPRYTSLLVKDLSDTDKSLIVKLLCDSYGDNFDESKTFLDTTSSVVFERQEEIIRTVCLIDGERIYAAAAKSGDGWIEIFNDLRRSNYNVWVTVDSYNPKIQALCSIAGFKIEEDPLILKKILESKYPHYKNQIETYREGNILLFRKKYKEDHSQVLLRT